MRGVIAWPDFVARERSGRRGTQPDEWCADISGPSIVTIPESNARDLLANGDPVARPDRLHVRVQWAIRYADAVDDFVTRVLPALKQLGGPGDVRIVFGFDS
jgi:hypothetical protein